ncbi:hypothetical protein [Aquimarina spongiae]|uniref:Uncharacterized protein n=1 Tax=Aquimarina spongiae TaxID=570521 RepID=A0A1M6I6R4_9FLAO|nr:hypothetical protein [Aquimarina spongiae]SHJ30118.1 hypothetical protein SAMN04488508_107151 [Aquimarina spongiae]
MSKDKKQQQKEGQEEKEKNKRISFEEAIDAMPQEAQLALRLIMDALKLSFQIIKSPHTAWKFYKKHSSKDDTSEEIESEVELASVIAQIEKNIIAFVEKHPDPSKAKLDEVLEASFKDIPEHLQPVVQMTTENVMHRLEAEKKEKAVKIQEQNQKEPLKEKHQKEDANQKKVENIVQKPDPNKEVEKQKNVKQQPEILPNSLKAKGKNKKRSHSVIENKKEKQEKSRQYEPRMRAAFCQPLNQKSSPIRDKYKQKSKQKNNRKLDQPKKINRRFSV